MWWTSLLLPAYLPCVCGLAWFVEHAAKVWVAFRVVCCKKKQTFALKACQAYGRLQAGTCLTGVGTSKCACVGTDRTHQKLCMVSVNKPSSHVFG